MLVCPGSPIGARPQLRAILDVVRDETEENIHILARGLTDVMLKISEKFRNE